MNNRNTKKAKGLRIGEIVRIRSINNLFPTTVCRVTMKIDDMLFFSVGDIRMGASRSAVEVLERNLPAPPSWDRLEISCLEEQVKICPCAECQKLLEQKRARLRAAPQDVLH